jgi:hypothetical protein
MMCDTAPLAAPHAPDGRARPPFIRPVLAPRTTTQFARSFPGKFRPWRDATLAADRQMMHFADVAPELAAALLAASLMRKPSLTRRVRAVRPPIRRVRTFCMKAVKRLNDNAFGWLGSARPIFGPVHWPPPELSRWSSCKELGANRSDSTPATRRKDLQRRCK